MRVRRGWEDSKVETPFMANHPTLESYPNTDFDGGARCTGWGRVSGRLYTCGSVTHRAEKGEESL